MKREIKFRGRRIDNGKFITGYYTVISGTHYISEQPEGQMYFDHEVDPETVGQYTGLKDKNGKMIWEGDKVKATLSGIITYEMESIVVFQGGCFGIMPLEDYALVDSKGKFKSFDQCDSEKLIEVIDNPELLQP